jgi:hypothetical protein
LPFIAASTARILYGLGCILAPERMAGRLAPTVRGPDSRMNLRGFGGAQSGIALYTLATAGTPAGARSALLLNAVVDGFDAMVSTLEIRDRGGVDPVAAGGVFVNVAGLICWTSAALALRKAGRRGRARAAFRARAR